MELSTILLTFVLLLVLRFIYRYVWEPSRYWEKRGVRHVSAFSPLSFFGIFSREHIHEIVMRKYKKYGKVFGEYEAFRPKLSVSDPELLRDIFVKDFQFFPNRRGFQPNDVVTKNMVSILRGDAWKRVRTIITPAFTTGKIKKMSTIILDSVKTVMRNIEEARKTGKTINAKRLFGAFTMDVIASSAFATKIDSHNDPDNPFVAAARKVFSKQFPIEAITIVLFPRIARLLDFRVFDRHSVEFFRNAVVEIIKERRRTGKKQNDFLQLMMDTADEESNSPASEKVDEKEAESEENVKDIGHEEANEEMFKRTTHYNNLSYDEVVANCVIFFLAGYDTTASALSFASYSLAVNPQCQEKLIAEVDEALRQNNNQLNYSAIQSMKYLDNVISETLRLYPALVSLERQTAADYKLGDTGITIPKDMIVTIPLYAMQRDAAYYPNPEKFDPDRFLPEQKAKREQYTFLTFGAGPRNCLGMRFALTEIKFCLASIFSQYRLKRCPETKVPVEFLKGTMLLQPKNIILGIEKREDTVWN